MLVAMFWPIVDVVVRRHLAPLTRSPFFVVESLSMTVTGLSVLFAPLITNRHVGAGTLKRIQSCPSSRALCAGVFAAVAAFVAVDFVVSVLVWARPIDAVSNAAAPRAISEFRVIISFSSLMYSGRPVASELQRIKRDAH
jgi:hypothetical protein